MDYVVKSTHHTRNNKVFDRIPKIYYLKLLRASEGTISCWSQLHLQSLAPTNPHWARVVGMTRSPYV
jgi:two-component SAPR family response regulator